MAKEAEKGEELNKSVAERFRDRRISQTRPSKSLHYPFEGRMDPGMQ